MKTIFGSAESGTLHDMEIQMSELISYREKVVALMNILEANFTAAANEPVARAPQPKTCCGLRKPIAAASPARGTKETAA
jgi:hypothetical protein